MKFGKQPKRMDRKSDAFLAKSNPYLVVPPSEGPINLYFDDDRPCPPGWTVARLAGDFFRHIEDQDIAARIERISFDGEFSPMEKDGGVIMHRFANYFVQDPQFLPNLKAIGLHSNNREIAVMMDTILFNAIPPERKTSIFVQWGTPRLDLAAAPKGFRHAQEKEGNRHSRRKARKASG